MGGVLSACQQGNVSLIKYSLTYRSQKYWREFNLVVEPKIAITRIFKFGGSVQDRHTYNNMQV